MSDSLENLPLNKWSEVQNAFKTIWPANITGYYVLDVQKNWLEQGVDFGFQFLCPTGDITGGLVVVHKKDSMPEMFIQCPREDTSVLEDALKRTKLVNWGRDMCEILFAPTHVAECLKRVAEDINVNVEWIHRLKVYVLNRGSPLFDVSLPPGITFGPLHPSHIELVDSKWPHRYPGSTFYFQVLIQTKSGYGLYKDKELIAWMFIKEMGALGHIYTLEEHRRQGYADVLVKLVCNIMLEGNKDIFSYCLEKNVASCRMHEKIGFDRAEDSWSLQFTAKRDNK